jgi:gamma-glutamyl phosphate reductase
MDLTLLGTKGKKASYELAKAAGQDKNDALAKIAEGLIKDIPVFWKPIKKMWKRRKQTTFHPLC